MAVEIVRGATQLQGRVAGCVATIGTFDGVHLGHQSLLKLSRSLADEAGGPVVAVTFDPMPARLLAPEGAIEPLMTLQQRCEALGGAGADIVLLLETTRDLLDMPPDQFIRDVLAACLAPSQVVEGRGFFFGHNRAGKVDTLATLGGQHGFDVHVIEAVTVTLGDGQEVPVSSSLIRRLVRAGGVEDAARCLGRPYGLQGEVVRGWGLGRQMDCPTANLDCRDQLLPADGVYAGWARLGGHTYPAALSVGTRPTFDGSDRVVEAHLLGEVGQLYGRPMAVQFVHYIRRQEEFDSPDQLRRQLAKDIKRVRRKLK